MSVIYFLVPIALILSFGFLISFIWLCANGEFDDLETPAYRILIDEEKLNRKDTHVSR